MLNFIQNKSLLSNRFIEEVSHDSLMKEISLGDRKFMSSFILLSRSGPPFFSSAVRDPLCNSSRLQQFRGNYNLNLRPTLSFDLLLTSLSDILVYMKSLIPFNLFQTRWLSYTNPTKHELITKTQSRSQGGSFPMICTYMSFKSALCYLLPQRRTEFA